MQKLKPLFLIYIFFVLLHASEAFGNKIDFHRPNTEAEKSLNNILIFYLSDNKDYSVMWYLLKAPSGYKIQDGKRVHKYEDPPTEIKEKIATMFSKTFMDKLAAAQEKYVIKYCDGEYPLDEPCYQGFDPIILAPDRCDGDCFMYRTIESSDSVSMIEYTWPASFDSERAKTPIARYKMIKKAPNWWMIDEIWEAPSQFHDGWEPLDKVWGGK